MSFQGLETFTTNSGQLSVTHFSTDAQGVVTFPATPSGVQIANSNTGFSSTIAYINNTTSDPTDGIYVSFDLDSLGTLPGSGWDYLVISPGIYDPATGQGLFAEFGLTPARLPNNFYFDVRVNFSGSWVNVGTGQQNFTAPFRHALALNGNNAEIWAYVSGTWTRLLSVDITPYFNPTLPGIFAGWKPSFSIWTHQLAYTFLGNNLQWGAYSDLSVSGFYPPTGLGGVIIPGPAAQLNWIASVPFVGNPLTQPPGYVVYRGGSVVGTVSAPGVTSFIDTTIVSGGTYTYTVAAADSLGNPISAQSSPITISASPVSVYGKFVGSTVYPAVEISRVGDIIPRIWPSKKNNTVFA